MFTTRQIAALKYIIFNLDKETELSKRVLAFLIDSSEGFTEEVCLSLVDGREGYDAGQISAAAHGVDNINITNHLCQILDAMGSGFKFSVHYGDFDPSRVGDPFNSDGMFPGIDESQVSRKGLVREGMPLRYTFWLSRTPYSRQAKLVVATMEKLNQIDLTRPGLYPESEARRT